MNTVHNCKPGENSMYVSALQYFLKDNGYWAQGTGDYDEITIDWMLKFKKDRNLPLNPICDEATWRELYKGKFIMINDRSFSTRSLQYLLNAHEYRTDIDGEFGVDTYNTLIKFQENSGLEPTGECGALTWNELIRE